MNRKLRFSWLCLLLVMFGLNSYSGTITFGDLGLENSVQYPEPFDGGDFTVTFGGGGNNGKYYTTGAAIRVYGDGTITVASKDGSPIKSIVFTFASGDNYRPTSADIVSVGTYNVASCTWTGSASSVVFTRPSGSGHWRVAAITVSFTEGDVPGPGPDEPEPDVQTVANIAAFKALADGTEAKLALTNAEVLYVNGTNDMYVRDASGAIDFYKAGLSFTAGQKLNGSVIGKYTLYQNTPEFVATDNTSSSKITATNGTATAKAINVDDAANYVCDLVKFSNVTVTKDGNNYYAVSPTGARVQVYDKFKLGVTPEDGQTYTIEGIIVPFRDVFEICPISDYTQNQGGDDPVVPEPTGKRVYKKATAVESGKAYLIVAEGKAAKPVAANKNYDWLYVDDVEDVNGIIEMDDETNDFVFTATIDGYTIMQSDGRYLHQKGTFNNFNVDKAPTEGQYWTVTANGDGTFKILNNNVNKWLQYSISHKSYGSYANEQGVMPALYVYDPDGGSVTPDVPTEAVVTFDATKDKTEEGQGEFSLTKDGVTMSTSHGMFGDGTAYRYYSGSTLTFTAAGGTITKIEFTSSANATSNNGLGGIAAPSTGTWTVDGKTAVWTGSASTVEFTMNKQVRAKLVNVTYTAGGEGGAVTGGGSQLSKYPYAKPELIAQAKELLKKIDDGDAAAADQLAELMKDIARSHSHAEGVSEAEDLTSLLTGEWTKEIFTDGEGIEGEGYFTASGKNIVARVYQTVQLRAGIYMLTATGRGQKYQTIADNIDERLQVMAINSDRLERYQSIARNDREGGVYGEGWDDASDVFTMTADGYAVIGARFMPKANTESFGEVGNFRLVRLGDAMRYLDAEDDFYNDYARDLGVVLHRALKAGEWNSMVLPFNVPAAQLEETFGKGAQVAQYDSEKDGVANFKTNKKANQITANVPVLLKPTEVSKSNLYIFDHVVMNTSIPKDVVKGNFKFTGYYNPTQTPVEGGYGFDLVERRDKWTALTTTAVLLPVADDAVLTAVTIDGKKAFSVTPEETEAHLYIVGAEVQTDEPADDPVEDPTVTGIESVNAESQQGAVYNVAGQRVERPVKGLYIVGGKKVVLK